MAVLSVGNSWAGSRLIESTSSSVRWVSASNTRRLSSSSSKKSRRYGWSLPSDRDQAAHRASRIRRAPSPDRHVDSRLHPAARAGHRATGAGLFHHQRMAVQIAVRADALHQGIHRHNQHAALHGGELIQRRQARGDDLWCGEKLS